MKIYSMKLENFKAIGNLEIFADGKNVVVGGQNGTGKTSISDAYTWALTGKFSDGNIGEINFFDANGNLIRDKKIHSVEIELDDKMTIRRELLNTFDKHGNFKATTQNFYIDGVVVKQKDFDAEILKITGGSALNPFSFCTMNWKERRQILMKMCPIDNAAVIATDKIFQELNLQNFAPEMVISMNKNEMKKFTSELDGIPARIDELNKKNFSTDGDEESLRKAEEILRKKLSETAEKVQSIQKIMAERDKPKSKLLEIQKKILQKETEISRNNSNVKDINKKLDELREEYRNVMRTKAGTCPTCGQSLPNEKFNAKKNKMLEELNARGQNLRAELENIKTENSVCNEELENLKWQQEELQSQIAASESAANMNELNAAISERDKIISELTQAENKLARFLQQKNDAEKNQNRIAELKTRETELNQKIADCQKQTDLAEKFIRAKVQLIENTVNSKFEFVKFKLFETLINGSIKEICEPMIDGVPYNDGLNRGAKFKAALDILKTLQKFFGVELPIFVDDAESYTSNSFVEIPNQIFLLKVVEGQKILKIDVEKNSEEKFSLELEGVKAA